MTQGGIFDPSGTYRYHLWREWEAALPRICFVMLNPSTADAESDDPTIRRCIGFARRWGYGGVEVVNLFALRATQPAELYRAADPVGPENDAFVARAMRGAALSIAAWGCHGALHGRDKAITRLLPPDARCFGRTRAGHPLHPLYQRADSQTIPFRDERPEGDPLPCDRF